VIGRSERAARDSEGYNAARMPLIALVEAKGTAESKQFDQKKAEIIVPRTAPTTSPSRID